jgi:hypothetical protein
MAPKSNVLLPESLLWAVDWVETENTHIRLGCRRALVPTSDIQDFNGRTLCRLASEPLFCRRGKCFRSASLGGRHGFMDTERMWCGSDCSSPLIMATCHQVELILLTWFILLNRRVLVTLLNCRLQRAGIASTLNPSFLTSSRVGNDDFAYHENRRASNCCCTNFTMLRSLPTLDLESLTRISGNCCICPRWGKMWTSTSRPATNVMSTRLTVK